MRRVLLLAAALLSIAPAHAAPAATPAGCKYVKIAELPVRFQGANFAPTVAGSINGQPATLLVDTGSFASLLTPAAVDKYELIQRYTGRHAEGIGGTSRLYGARVKEFGIGPTHSKGMNLDILGDLGFTPEFDAIVGADFLFQADIEISLTEHALRFFRPLECPPDSFLAYWTKDAVIVPLTGALDSSKNNTFTVELNGVKLDAIIDTGATFTTVFESAARKAGVKADHASSRAGGTAVGVGSERVTQRSAVFTTFAIGGETIREAELKIAPDNGRTGVDMLLGADFLRSHRVLFAMSQRQLYINYLGGEVFARDSRAIPPWLQQEADSGNPDALLTLANIYAKGVQVPRDVAKATALLEQAAAKDHPAAILQLAEQRMRSRRYFEAATLYGRAQAARPDERRTWLMLYLARLHAGEPARANTDLAERLAADSKRAWPAPVGEFFLGRIDAAGLLALANKEEDSARPRRCQARAYMAMLAGARGDTALAASLNAERAADCKADAR